MGYRKEFKKLKGCGSTFFTGKPISIPEEKGKTGPGKVSHHQESTGCGKISQPGSLLLLFQEGHKFPHPGHGIKIRFLQSREFNPKSLNPVPVTLFIGNHAV